MGRFVAGVFVGFAACVGFIAATVWRLMSLRDV